MDGWMDYPSGVGLFWFRRYPSQFRPELAVVENLGTKNGLGFEGWPVRVWRIQYPKIRFCEVQMPPPDRKQAEKVIDD